MKTLLIIDDDDIMQDMLQKYLTAHDFCVKSLGNGEHMPLLLNKNKIDLIVLDIMLPNKNGLYWLKWLQQYYEYIPVIVASVKIDEEDRVKGLENGARDYLIKPFHHKELLIRIENILGKSTSTGDKYIHIGDMQLDTETGIISKQDISIKLTQLESNILKLLYINSGIVMSRDDIMEQIRGLPHNPLDRSIDIHINKLRKKIEVNPPQPAYIRTVRGKGYRLHLT